MQGGPPIQAFPGGSGGGFNGFQGASGPFGGFGQSPGLLNPTQFGQPGLAPGSLGQFNPQPQTGIPAGQGQMHTGSLPNYANPYKPNTTPAPINNGFGQAARGPYGAPVNPLQSGALNTSPKPHTTPAVPMRMGGQQMALPPRIFPPEIAP